MQALLLAFVAFAAASPASPQVPAEEGYGQAQASAYASLGADALAMRLSLAGASSYLGFGIEAEDGELGLSGCLGLGAFEGPGTGILLGPGSVAGITRALVDPTSPTALTQGSPVELDKSLESRTSVLGIHAGPVFLFALAEGSGISRELGSSAAGISCGVSGPDGGVAAITAVSYGKSAAPVSGWRPDPSACPAATIVDQPAFSAAIVADRRGGTGASLVALAASYGRIAGPGIAFRMESREVMGPFRLRVAAGVAASSFRELLGPRQERLLEAIAEARLAMRRSSSLRATVETQAKASGLLYAPLWGKRGSLALLLPTGGVAGGFFQTRVDVDAPSEGPRGGSWSLQLVRKSREHGASSQASLGGSLRWESALSGVDLSLQTELAGQGGLPVLSLDLSLEVFGGGKPESPVAATGGLRIALPFGRGASLELNVSLPENGVPLGPSRASGPAFSPVLGLRYRASAGTAAP
jgi:hypothetical protein